jgi:hypothetical protein
MQYMIIEKSSRYALQDEVQMSITSFNEAWAQATEKNNA